MLILLTDIVTTIFFVSITVKEAGRDFTYLIVVLVGIGVTGYIKSPYAL